MEKRYNDQAVVDARQSKAASERADKAAMIRAMPAWKRKMYLERNPQFKDLA